MEMPERIEMSAEELDALVARLESGTMVEGDLDAIKAMAESIKLLRSAVQEKTMSVKRLLRMLFGAPTETSKNVLNEGDGDEEQTASESHRGDPSSTEKPKAKGHGRNGAADYPGAERVAVPHESLKRGDPCPECPKGKVYPLKTPAMVLCIVGTAPVQATVYELEKLRCNLCGAVFTAEPPVAC